MRSILLSARAKVIAAAIAAAALVAVPAIVSVATVEAPVASSAAGSGGPVFGPHGPGYGKTYGYGSGYGKSFTFGTGTSSHWGPFKSVGVSGGHHKYQDPYGNWFTDNPSGSKCAVDIDDKTPTATCFDTVDETAGYLQAQGVSAADTSSITDSSGTTTAIGLLGSSSYVLGTIYKDTNYGGSSLTIYGSGTCDGPVYGISSMPSGWNDTASSAKGSNGCWVQVYQNANYGGTMMGCNPNCGSFPGLNDAASSLKFY